MKIREIVEQSGPLATIQAKIQNLQSRCESMMSRILTAAGKEYTGPRPRIIVAVLDNSFANTRGHTGDPRISIDVTAFWDAAPETLCFVLAHELGHLAGRHHPALRPISYELGGQARRDLEFEADAFAGDIMLRLGYNQASVFNWMFRKKEDYDAAEQDNAHPDSTHPTFKQRSDLLLKYRGLKISAGGLDQLNHMLS